MAKTPEEEKPYRGAERRELSDSARMLSAAFGAASGIPDMGTGVARAGQIKGELPESHPPVTVHELHTVVHRPPLTKTIRPPRGKC